MKKLLLTLALLSSAPLLATYFQEDPEIVELLKEHGIEPNDNHERDLTPKETPPLEIIKRKRYAKMLRAGNVVKEKNKRKKDLPKWPHSR